METMLRGGKINAATPLGLAGLLLLLLLDLSLLVEDLLRLAVADEKDNGGKDEDDGARRVYSFGFGYGATWGSIILIFASVVLLICDRESEEIFYKERQVEEEEEEESGEA